MTLRTLIFWPHLIAGVIAGALVLIMSVTGVVLTYERQFVAWGDGQFRSTQPSADAGRLPIATAMEALRRDHPEITPTAVVVGSASDAPIAVSVQQRTLYVDAYTGRLLGEGSQSVRRLMSSVRAWHRWLNVEGDGRATARFFTGWSNFLFLFIAVSGFYLWFPRKWTFKHLRPVVWFARTSTAKARDFNWHNVIGAWSAIPLFIIVLSALPMSFPWANALIYRAVGEQPPVQGQGGRGGREGGGVERAERGGRERAAVSLAGIDDLLARAEKQVPGWKTINIRIPNSDRAPVAFAIDGGDGGQPQLRSTLTLNRATGEVVSYESFSDQSLGRRLRSIARFAHTGEVLGIPGQTIAGLATLGAVFLVYTGLSLVVRRYTAWLKRRRERATVSAPQESTAA
jgi:uncharacterized iron-regulated membrane protein